MAEKLTAAVIGASGIGKHHVKWLNNLGCEVAGFVGTTPASVEATGEVLREELGVEVAGYTDVGDMLADIEPQVVNICSPPNLHYNHFMAVAPRGCHIMCEKPLTWDEKKSLDQLVFEAREMAEYGVTDVVHAVNTQYVAVLPAYYELCEKCGRSMGPPEKFFMQLESRHTNKVYERVWIDIATHPLSLLMAFCGDGDVVPGSEDVVVNEHDVVARFSYQPQDGPVCEAEIIVRAWCTEGIVRRFGINDVNVDYAGRNDENGVFCTYLSLDGTESKSDDIMYDSLSRFVGAIRKEVPAPLAHISEGYVNEKIHLSLLKAAKRE